MPARTPPMPIQPTTSDTRCATLFASSLQPSHTPTASMIATAIRSALQRFGPQGCTERMAQEFGDHPEAASPKARPDDLCAVARAGSAIVGRAESVSRSYRCSGSTSVICPVPAQARSRRSSYVKTGTERSCLLGAGGIPAAAGCRASVRRRRQPCGRACPARAPGPALARATAPRAGAQRRGPSGRWSKFPGFRNLRAAGRAYGGPHARVPRHGLRLARRTRRPRHQSLKPSGRHMGGLPDDQ